MPYYAAWLYNPVKQIMWKINKLSHLGPFPGDSADAVVVVEQRLVGCGEQRVFKQTSIHPALSPQSRERLALVGNHHPPAHTETLVGFLVLYITQNA